ncbi:hypothetical protein [Mesorhizobium sp. M0843]|uniref:hypothetical protein n=1 Tax=Mesorhizobium sp. M0843 TaxID=2957010 RepID=UPI00333BDF9F
MGIENSLVGANSIEKGPAASPIRSIRQVTIPKNRDEIIGMAGDFYLTANLAGLADNANRGLFRRDIRFGKTLPFLS